MSCIALFLVNTEVQSMTGSVVMLKQEEETTA
jgi:hypothetical protein